MKLSQVNNYISLLEYTKQNPFLSVKRYIPHTPLYPDREVELLIHYKTPIAFIIDKEIYTPHYVKENFISMTTAKISSQICKFSHVVDINSYIYMLYEELGCTIIEKNKPFYDAYVKLLVG